MQCTQGLGILLWGCRKTTRDTPRDHHGPTWHTLSSVYVPKATTFDIPATAGLTAESTNASSGTATADDEIAFRKPTTTAGVPTTTTKAIQMPAEFLLHLKCLLHKLQGLELPRTRC
ncbi:hypothetical protein P5673_031479 [Acropora cervicornis]|uniref:Uncharacterized protein n=1 Tax=Acropora cervicornis TaxID=6130 RepID=A0AAD9USR1_ACRCE|nr:hypothetical protein P5673_031479 [Acropora cervicornis]